MFKRICTKKITISIIILVLINILYFIPDKKEEDNVSKKISYVNYELNSTDIYLFDKNNYLTRIKISTNNEKENLVKEIFSILSCNDTSKIPNGFTCTINKDTKINSLDIKNNILKIDLSSNFLDIDKNLEEKSLESLIYSLTSIEEIKNIIIYIDGKILTKLPKNNITLPNTLNRDFGINKKYNLTSTNNISKTTIFYINKYDNNIFYTPITLINNDTREKIEIIIDELSNKIIDSNLNSYLNNDTKVLNNHIKDNTMYINFNENILNGIENNTILEEVIYTISLSINENYDIKNVFFDVNNKEIAKTTIKSLE